MIIDFVVMKAILPKSILISSKIQLQYNDVWKMSKRMEEYFRLYNHVHKAGSLMFVMTTIQLLEAVEVPSILRLKAEMLYFPKMTCIK